MGQPRIWMSMSRDGLLPKKFSKVHPKYKTPSFSTIVVGFVVAIPALFMNLTMVTELCSIGTLFAFVLVCGGILVLQNKTDIPRGKFKTPYVNGKYVLPFLVVGAIVLLFSEFKNDTMNFVLNKPTLKETEEVITDLSSTEVQKLNTAILKVDSIGLNRVGSDLSAYFEQEPKIDFSTALEAIDFKDTKLKLTEIDSITIGKLSHFLVGYDEKGFKLMNQSVKLYFEQGPKLEFKEVQSIINLDKNRLYNAGFSHFAHKIPTWIFILFTLFITIVTIRKNLSLIPLLGLLSCLYMMSQIQLSNWIYFTAWLLIGLLIYFGYSKRHSKLNKIAAD
jgi:amino acid transporter